MGKRSKFAALLGFALVGLYNFYGCSDEYTPKWTCEGPEDCIGRCNYLECQEGECKNVGNYADAGEKIPDLDGEKGDCNSLECGENGTIKAIYDPNDNLSTSSLDCFSFTCEKQPDGSGKQVVHYIQKGFPCLPCRICDGKGLCLPDPETTGCGPDPIGCLIDKNCDPSGAGTLICMEGRCVPPTCNNHQKGESETDVDCGGLHCLACANGKTCKDNLDCISKYCPLGVCN